jgi:hypothetical protein
VAKWDLLTRFATAVLIQWQNGVSSAFAMRIHSQSVCSSNYATDSLAFTQIREEMNEGTRQHRLSKRATPLTFFINSF